MLNKRLYRLLVAMEGEENVVVVNAGQEMVASYVLLKSRVRGGGSRSRLKPVVSGEEYRINCPFCSDQRKRLYINHRWGEKDRTTGTRNMWLANCWNENCCRTFDTQMELWRLLTSQVCDRRKPVEQTTNRVVRPYDEVVRAPGPPWSLLDIVSKNPGHRAVTYLQNRLIDPAYIAHVFDVGFIIESPLPLARNRLYAPVVMKGELVGWQCRQIDASDPAKKVPKWFTMPGGHKGDWLYNYDNAVLYSTTIVLEGPSDVWNFGQQAVGLFGKALSKNQQQMIADMTGPEDTVVIMLDPDLPSDHKPGVPHHIEKACEDLNSNPNLRGRVLPVYLPKGTDPGMMDRYYMRSLISTEARRQGLKVSFARKVKEGS